MLPIHRRFPSWATLSEMMEAFSTASAADDMSTLGGGREDLGLIVLKCLKTEIIYCANTGAVLNQSKTVSMDSLKTFEGRIQQLSREVKRLRCLGLKYFVSMS